MRPQHSIQTLLLLGWLCFGSPSLSHALADETWTRTSDGRLIVDLKGIRVGLPILAADDSRSSMSSSVQLYFPGPHLDILSVPDLMRKPEESRRHIAEAKLVTLVVHGGPGDWFNDIIGGVSRVSAVGLASGPEANCNSWKRTYRDWRNKSLGKSADSNGWISQGEGGFVRFADDDNRDQSRYHAENCNLFGYCRMTVCRDGLTTSFNFNGTGKSEGFGQPIDTGRFDDAIRFAIDKLDRLLLDRKADLTYRADE
jgi:hypothetical protein